jgi:WD40 repeat protein
MKKILAFLLLIISTKSFSQKEQVVVPTGHSLQIEQVIVDEQQKYLYSAENEKIIMWDVTTGNQLYTFPINGKSIKMALSHAGDKIAFANETQLSCYSTINGKKIFTIDYTLYETNTLCFSNDDKRILLPDEKGIAWIDAATGDHDWLNDFVFDNQFSNLYIANDGKDFLLTSNYAWQLMDGNTGSIKKEGKNANADNVLKTWFLPYSNIFVYGANGTSQNSVITFQNINTGAIVKKLTIPQNMSDVVLVPSSTDERFLLSEGATNETKYKLYNTSTFAVLKTFGYISPRKYYPVVTGYFIGDKNKIFLSAYSDLFAFNTQSGSITKSFKRTVASLGFDVFSSYEYNSANGELNLVCDDSTLKRINLFTMKPERHVVIHTDVENVAISPGGDSIMVMDYGVSYLKNIATNTMLKPDAKIRTVSGERGLYTFSNDGNYVFYPDKSKIVSGKQALYKWNLTTNAKQEILQYDFINAYNYSADKQLLSALVTNDDAKSAVVYNLSTAKRVFKKTVNDEYYDLKFYTQPSADDARLLLQTGDTLAIYNLEDGTKISSSNFPRYDGSIAASNNLSSIAIGSENGMLTVINADGKEVFNEQAHNSGIRNIFFSPDDKILYTESHDQTIKVWNAGTGKLLGTLYLFSDGNDYVFVDEFGRFDGTEDGIKKLYYLKNRNTISLDLVYEKYYTPNLYQRLVNGEVFPPMPSDDLKKAPLVKIQYAEKQRNLEVDNDVPSYQNTTGAAEIMITASSEDDVIDEIRLFQNGKVLNLATRNLIVEDDKSKTSTKKYSVNLLPGVNEIRAVALNTQRTESTPDVINVVYNDGASVNTNATPVVNNNSNVIVDKIDKNATMHLVVVGINAYKNPKMSLNYALADATAFKDEVEKDAKTVISNIKTYFVTDDAADKTGIIKALEQVQQNAKPQDVFIFYYAGHGVIAGNKEFYLVPNDVTDLKNVDEALKEHGIEAKDLQQYAINIQAQKQLFILDACQSAAAFADMLSDDGNQQKNIALVARSTGTHWMAASGAQQFANEFSTLGHGAFTYVLLQALKGEAANKNMITVDGLKTYMQNGVPALMKKYNGSQQIPASYGFGNDFPVEIIK